MNELFEGLARSSERERAVKSSPRDVLCVTLREVAENYARPCPFKVGDLVTPRNNGAYKGSGDPHIVIAVRENPEPIFEGLPGSPGFGFTPDIRVAGESHGDITLWWVESAEFEPYSGPDAGREAA